MLFPKADVAAINGLIPGKNFIEWAKIIGRPAWWPILLLVPIVNIFIFAGMAVNLVRSFSKYSLGHSAGAVVYAPASFAWLAKNDSAKYTGPNYTKEKAYLDEVKTLKKNKDERRLTRLMEESPYRKSVGREWVESLVFAVFAASFIRMFLFEAFVIPTPSMEGSLMVGDYLFVSKTSYGIRTPMTIAMLPLLHNRIPGIGTESYLKKPSLDYNRLPGTDKIEHNKPIVFNWPVGDSVYITKKRSYTVGQVDRDKGFLSIDKDLRSLVQKKDFVVRPIDKKDHYIKRCVAMPGDTIRIVNRQIFLNGKPAENPREMQFLNHLKPPSTGINPAKLKEWGVGDTYSDYSAISKSSYHITEQQKEKLTSIGIESEYYAPPIEPIKLFPHDPQITKGWTVDNYGPIWIPKKGATTPLSLSNLSVYRRVIEVYENNQLEVKQGQIYINGEQTDSYTFQQNYYWAMGDNRHNSEDSRMWGFVPMDHIVGKPICIWFSTRNARLGDGIRFDRIFKSANVK